MSDILLTMQDAAKSDVAAYTLFILQYNEDQNDTIYCFFEGNDDFKYYRHRIIDIVQHTNVFPFVCNGKEGVIKVYHLLESHAAYRTARKGFFIDKDFDSTNGNPDIYETPHYSFDNFYFSSSTIEALLRTDFGMIDNNDLNLCINRYSELLTAFLDDTLVLNSWLACYADKRNSGDVLSRLFIDKTTKKAFHQVITANFDAIDIKVKISDKRAIDTLFNYTEISQEELNEKVNLLAESDKKSVFRGKTILKFFIEFLRKLQGILANRQLTFCSKTYRCALTFSEPAIYTQLNTYAETPDCLKEYIRRIAA